MKKKNKKLILISLFIIILIIISVGGLFILKNKDYAPKKISVDNKKQKSPYRMSCNSIEDFDLYFLQLENKEQNKIYSPLSIKYALEMLQEGTKDNSKIQISNIVGNYKSKKYVNDEHMSFANAMFIKTAFKESIKEDYTKSLSNKFNAEIIYDSFENPSNINSWVSNKTFNLINNLFDNVSDKDFILINALAINMEWKKLIQATIDHYDDIFSVDYKHENFTTFIEAIESDNYKVMNFNNKDNTKSVEIGAAVNNYDIVKDLGEENIRKTITKEYEKWLSEGGCGNDLDTNSYVEKYINELNSNYKNITTSTDFLFYNDENIKVFAKDLKEYNGTNLEYIGIMPKKEELSKYIENISAKKLNSIINNLKDFKIENFKEGVITKIIGQIPLFKFDYELNLITDLKKLGITDIFDINKANLSNMTSNNNLAITSATHKANIEFSNEGIKAAAATQMGGLGSSGCWFEYNYDVPVETIDLTFDNPYLFLIRDKSSNEIWFTGTVYEGLLK